MRQLFTRNLGWKLLSLVIAVVLWLAVAREPEVATSLSVPVEFKNMRDDLDINGSLPDRVRLEVRGPSGRLSRDNLSTLAVVLDLSDAQAGESTYTIRARNLNLPSGVVFYRAVPSQLTLRFEQLAIKEAPVQPVFVNKAPSYRIASQQVNPAKVRIQAPRIMYKGSIRLRRVPVDLSGVSGEKVFHTHVNLGDAQVRMEAPAEITVRVKLEKDFEWGCTLVARALFGTDGIRGVAGQAPLDPKTAQAVGAALGRWVIESKQDRPLAIGQVVIGMDTRESGPWLAAEVAAGLARYHVNVEFAGVTTTPGVAYLAKTGPFAAGVMISASHNPYQDNGIKLIGHAGYKLPDEQEELLEKEIFALLDEGVYSAPAPLAIDAGLDRTYVDHLASTLPCRLDGLKIVADCANGSASILAPELFERLGARVHPIHCSPDGRNINLNCGSLHLDALRSVVLEQKADVGVAFDGDADRALFVARSGKIVDGDAVLFLTARYLKEHGQLTVDSHPPVVIATVMSNLGLERALGAHGIGMIRTPVGDKYVLEEMLRRGAVLGGEQSGHVIFHRHATTGDGMLTALRVFEVMRQAGAGLPTVGLDELTDEIQVYPQRLVNVRIKERKRLEDLPAVAAEIRAAEDSFGDSGRVLVRFSGTEPLARVMVEGPELDRVEAFANRIASRIRDELGGDDAGQVSH